MADPRDFLLNTDYEMDQVVLVKTGTVAPGTTEIAHGLPFTPLVFGKCASRDSFSDSTSFPYMSSSANDPVLFEVRANNAILRIINNTGGPMHYRIYGLEPANCTESVGPTRNAAQTFILNTDLNYRKLYAKGSVPLGGQQVIAHNLGYIPQVMTWYEDSNGLVRLSTTPNATVNNNVISFSGTAPAIIHYRIYYDEA